MQYKARAVVQNEDGHYVGLTAPFEGFVFDTFEEARNGFVPLFKALASVLTMVYHDDTRDVWFEIFDTKWGAVSWEGRAKDLETLTVLPF